MTRLTLHTRLTRAVAAAGLLCFTGPAAWAVPPTHSLPSSAVVTTITGQDHEDPEHPDACWRDNYVSLSDFPVGMVLHNRGVRLLDAMIPVQPIGYPAHRYTHYPGITYAFGNSLEVSAQVVTATPFGSTAEPVFYGLGIQKQVYGPACPHKGQWAASVGGYGYTGNGWTGGAGYVATTGLVSGTPDTSGALYAHAGLTLEAFSNSESKTGLRPYVGFTWVIFRHALTLNGEIAAKQSWEVQPPFALKVAFPVYKGYSLSLGIKNNGFDTVFSGPI